MGLRPPAKENLPAFYLTRNYSPRSVPLDALGSPGDQRGDTGLPNFGYTQVKLIHASNQRQALGVLVDLAQQSSVDPDVRALADNIVGNCDSRDDLCELKAIYSFVKTNVKYQSDARYGDQYWAPTELIKRCKQSASQCSGDCDDQTALIMALAGSIGFRMGARAWGETSTEYVHVYPVACLPKIGPNISRIVAMDATVPDPFGWEPPDGKTMTCWIE